MNARTLDEIRREGKTRIRNRPGIVFDQALCEAARRLWYEHHTIDAMAAQLGVPATTLRYWIYSNREIFPRRTGDNGLVQRAPVDGGPAMHEAGRLHRDEQLSAPQIARRLAVPLHKVKAWIAGRPDIFPPRARLPDVTERAPQKLNGVPAPATYQAGLDTLRPGRTVPRLPGEPVPLMELTLTTCRWPVDGRGARMLFCGGQTTPGASYCDQHQALATGRSCEEVR